MSADEKTVVDWIIERHGEAVATNWLWGCTPFPCGALSPVTLEDGLRLAAGETTLGALWDECERRDGEGSRRVNNNCYNCGEPGCAGCGYPLDTKQPAIRGSIRWKVPPAPIVREPDWKSRALAAEAKLAAAIACLEEISGMHVGARHIAAQGLAKVKP